MPLSLNGTTGIVTGNIADANVTSTKLANTGVSAASYTNANITINAQGQITAASNGSAPVTSSQQIFAASGTFTVPTGVTTVRVTCIGGGGGGSGEDCARRSGGQGGIAIGRFTVTPGANVTVTVGSGGAGGASATASGAAGGASSFGAFCSATGGSGGVLNGTVTPGAGSSGYVNSYVTSGQVGGLYGALISRPSNAGASPAAWSNGSNFVPGAFGVTNANSPFNGVGGIGGAVMVEW